MSDLESLQKDLENERATTKLLVAEIKAVKEMYNDVSNAMLKLRTDLHLNMVEKAVDCLPSS